MDIKDQSVVVIGGASGLGAAVCEHLSSQGAVVCVCDRDEAGGKQVSANCGGKFFHVDVCDSASIEKAAAKIQQIGPPIRAVINTAGVCLAERLLGKKGIASMEHFEQSIRINLIGTFDVMRHFAAVMQSQPPSDSDNNRGVLINTASIAATEGQIGQAAYSASKAGIIGMALPIARELAAYGIRVMTIAPGIFDTPMMAGLSDTVRNNLNESVPFPKRLGNPAEFAGLVQHIIDNDYLNGETIRLDGAIRMG